MNIKNRLLLLLLFLGINMSVFYLTQASSNQKINIVLKDNLKTLQTHYKILLETQKTTAEAIYATTLNLNGMSEIMTEAKSATKVRRDELREEFRKLVDPMYKIIKKRGVLQYHFVFSDNRVFYRAHKAEKFNDDLSDTRADFKYTNETKKPIRAFVQGKTAHGFRNVFPLFDKNSKHIGAMEVSFSSDNLQWYLNNVSGIHTHFIVNKHIFDSNTWQRDDLVLKYKQSAEAQNYMITLNDLHTKRKCIDLNRERLYPIREEIDLKMAKGDAFSSYVEYRDEIVVVAFLPIKNLTDETVAWLVSYEKSPIIEGSLLNRLIIIIATFFLSILIIYFLIKETLSKQEISKQHKLLNNILNATDNVMFITDFKDVKFSNNKFKDLLNVQHSHIFNTSHNHYMLEIFVNSEGYLHSGLLKENESFVSLIARTSTIDRVVSIVDKNFVPVAFKISVSKSEDEDDYLVTLSDITKMKEHQTETEKKAYTDGLTNIYNRNKFDEVFVEEINNSQRFNIPFCIALIDIDKFKDFNDTYGHLIGDEVLISMAHTVNENVRVTDTFARWGGEEFVILFKNTTIDIAKKVSEKLKDRIEENRHPIAGSITASFGVTEYVASDTLESVFKRCDDALYAAKENGRNRVEVF